MELKRRPIGQKDCDWCRKDERMTKMQLVDRWAEQSDEAAGSARIIEYIETWELAKRSYATLLETGIDRSDKDLARDCAYRLLLQAGQKLHLMGGAEAVGIVSVQLGQSHQLASAQHFERLWRGLMPSLRTSALH